MNDNNFKLKETGIVIRRITTGNKLTLTIVCLETKEIKKVVITYNNNTIIDIVTYKKKNISIDTS